MTILSLAGIFVGMTMLIYLTYKGHSVIWAAPLSAFVVVLFALGAGLGEGRTLLSVYTTDYMMGVGNYFISWFPMFLLGAIFGKMMELTGSARELADNIVRLFGPRFVVLAVLIPCLVLTYGGVSLFVVVFIMYPMGSTIFRAARVPKRLLPPVIAFGILGITMTCIPGSPQIQNLIPMKYFGTTATAAPWLGLAVGLITGIAGYVYLDRRVRTAQKNAAECELYPEDPAIRAAASSGEEEHPSRGTVLMQWVRGLLPLIVVFVTLNVLNWHIVISLITGIASCALLHIRQLQTVPKALTEGAKSSITAMMNTACAVGFGSVIQVVPGFALLTGLLTGNITTPHSLLLSESLSVGILSGVTGSASGGLSIALDAFADQYLQLAHTLQVSPELLHRVAAMASGCLDKLPQNGAVITMLVVCQCTHRESYKDILVVSILIPTVIFVLSILLLGLFL